VKILFLSRWFPTPADNGSKIRILNLLQGLALEHELTLLSFAEPKDEENVPALKDICRKVVLAPWREFNPKTFRAVLGFGDPRPRSIVDTYSKQMEQRIITELAARPAYDLVIASQLTMASYQAHFGGLPALFEELELAAHFNRYTTARPGLSKLRHWTSWFKLQSYLSRLLSGYKAVTVVSEKEKQIVSRVAPARTPVHVIPNCLDVSNYPATFAKSETPALIFTGSFAYAPNYEAVCFFLEKIFPLVLEKMPQVRLKITGSPAGRVLPAGLLSRQVEHAGYVPDIKPVIGASWVSVVPLLEGGGTRLKILEAMALGTPVVSTRKGAEGLDAQTGQDLFIADSPQEFANSILSLLAEPALRDRFSRNGRRLVEQAYNWKAVMPGFLEIVEQISRSSPG
jgi:polysaccharide biosynthesis protein PslH